jgi:hypothetical protein
VLYVAIGRRLGYPLKLVECKGHLFVRWEDAKERFNIEGTSRGLHGRIKTSSTPPEIKNRALVSVYDVYSRELRIAEQPGASSGHGYECRPFCFLPDRDQVFFLHGREPWLYDVKTNAWTRLQPKGNLPAKFSVTVAEYIEGQDAVWCALINPAAGKRTEYWVYSLKRNAWTCMAENGASIGAPYGQAAYVARYGVLVAVPSTRVMRLDVEKLNWGVE